MDALDQSSGKDEEQVNRHQTFETHTEPNAKPSSPYSEPSLDRRESDPHTNTDVDPLSPDMDGGDAYRRRKAQLMAEHQNGGVGSKNYGKQHARPHRAAGPGNLDDEGKYPTVDGPDSDFSSVTTSDDVEMDHLRSDEAFTDDEETGLTKKDKRRRKRRRRKATGLDARIGGNPRTSKQERTVADRDMIKAMILNALLIASWYFFSLSISIVSASDARLLSAILIAILVQQVDVLRKVSQLPLPFIHHLSTHACAVLSRFHRPILRTALAPSTRKCPESTHSDKLSYRIYSI